MITRESPGRPLTVSPGRASSVTRRTGPSLVRKMPVSATLAANEVMAARRRHGLPVLPLAFGEAGLPVHPALRGALAAATASNGYGPVAGHPALRSAAAEYWTRRGLPTSPEQVVCGPGSKPLLFGLLLALGGDVALPRPSWVSYAAQAAIIGARPHFVPAAPGEGGICDPAVLSAAITAAAAAGRRIGSVVVTLPDNPTGRLPRPATVRALCEVAAAHGLVIISDEIYRDLVHDPATLVLSPAQVAPERTVITTGLSKSLALGGWRIGVARMPVGPLGRRLRKVLLGAGSEIWSAPAAPVQHAADPGLHRTPADPPAHRGQPCPARHGRDRRRPRMRRRRADRPAAAGRLLRLPRLRALARPPAGPPPGDHLRRAGPAAAGPLRCRHPARTAPSANPPPRCGYGWPPLCSTATAPTSRRQPSPPPTPPRCHP